MSIPQSAKEWIDALHLQEHPEGGWFREVYRSEEQIPSEGLPSRYPGPRSMGTSIYFLVPGDRPTLFHRLRSDETWHFHAGTSTIVHLLDESKGWTPARIGLDVRAGDQPQVQIRRGTWFAATVIDPSSYALVGCTVQPGFEFEDFELADRGTLLERFPEHRDVVIKGTADPAA